MKTIYNWLKNISHQYLGGLERKPTIVLVGAVCLLTIHRYYIKTNFFRKYLAGYFMNTPTSEIYPYYYWFLGSTITLMLIPMALIKWGIRESPRDYGWRFSNGRWGGSFMGIAFGAILPIVALLALYSAPFQQKYPLCKIVATRWSLWTTYAFAYGVYMLSWEFFFRGYMLFGLEERFGNYSILIQTIPFTLLHYGKPFVESMGAIFAGIILGIVAFRTRSFLYGALLHWLVAMSMDIFVVLNKMT